MSSAPNNQNFETLVGHIGTQGWTELAPSFLRLWQSSPENLKFGLMAGAGLLHTERQAEGTALLSHLADRGHIIRTAQYNSAIDLKLREASHLADNAIRKSCTDVQTQAIAACEAPGRIATAVWPQTHYGPPPFPPQTNPPDRTRPRPYVFYAPELPPIEVFDTANWAASLSQHTEAIRTEFLAIMAKDHNAGTPYVAAESQFGQDWAALKGQKNWNAVHLFKDGKAQEAAADCPLTCQALEHTDITLQYGVPIEAFFSVLAAGTTIPPHYGLANSRVTVHLPLIVPSQDPDICGIRVGRKTRGWNVGAPFIFDDSFDHSAWNLSDQTRVVLIFEAWRPDMTSGEIAAVKASYEAREDSLKTRGEFIRKLAAERPSAST